MTTLPLLLMMFNRWTLLSPLLKGLAAVMVKLWPLMVIARVMFNAPLLLLAPVASTETSASSSTVTTDPLLALFAAAIAVFRSV